jgi:hypothetical protein
MDYNVEDLFDQGLDCPVFSQDCFKFEFPASSLSERSGDPDSSGLKRSENPAYRGRREAKISLIGATGIGILAFRLLDPANVLAGVS